EADAERHAAARMHAVDTIGDGLDVLWVDVLAGGDDDVLLAAGDEEMSAVVDAAVEVAEVAGVEEAVGVEERRVQVVASIVAGEQERRANEHAADGARSERW